MLFTQVCQFLKPYDLPRSMLPYLFLLVPCRFELTCYSSSSSSLFIFFFDKIIARFLFSFRQDLFLS
jgi:hypothetical protein